MRQEDPEFEDLLHQEHSAERRYPGLDGTDRPTPREVCIPRRRVLPRGNALLVNSFIAGRDQESTGFAWWAGTPV